MPNIITEIVSPFILQGLKSRDTRSQNHGEFSKAISALMQSIAKIEFYRDWMEFHSDFKQIQREYPNVFSHRNEYFWQWVQVAFQLVTLDIPRHHFRLANSLKFRSASIAILLDDLCDNARDESLFRSCLDMLRTRTLNGGQFLHEMLFQHWIAVHEEMQTTPNYSLLKAEIANAYGMLFDGLNYALSFDDNGTNVDWTQYFERIPHTIHVYLGGLFDLLFLPDFSYSQLRSYKRVFLTTQKMAQVGNWVSTWERETLQGDYTSGVLLLAIENGLIKRRMKSDTIIQRVKNSNTEKYFLQKWHSLREQGYQACKNANIPGLKDYVDSFSTILLLQLARKSLSENLEAG